MMVLINQTNFLQVKLLPFINYHFLYLLHLNLLRVSQHHYYQLNFDFPYLKKPAQIYSKIFLKLLIIIIFVKAS